MIREYIIKISDEIMENEIADRPQELVRCKDCKHYHKGFNCDLMQKPFFKDDEWFCADGEPREEK